MAGISLSGVVGDWLTRRIRDMEPDDARNALGIVALVAGVAGISLSGVVGDWLTRRIRGAYAILAGTSFLLGFPAILIGLLSENPWVFLPALTIGAFCIFFCMNRVLISSFRRRRNPGGSASVGAVSCTWRCATRTGWTSRSCSGR